MHTLQLIAFFELIAYNLSDILPRSSINSDWIQECDIASDRQLSSSLLVFFVFSISVLFSVIFFHLVLANSSRSLNCQQTVHTLPSSLISVLIFRFPMRNFGVIASSLEYQYLTTRLMNILYLHFSHS